MKIVEIVIINNIHIHLNILNKKKVISPTDFDFSFNIEITFEKTYLSYQLIVLAIHFFETMYNFYAVVLDSDIIKDL